MAKPVEADRPPGSPHNQRPSNVVGLLYDLLMFVREVSRNSGMLVRLLVLVFGVGVVVTTVGPLHMSATSLDLTALRLGHLDWWKVLGAGTGGSMAITLIVRRVRLRKAAKAQALKDEILRHVSDVMTKEIRKEMRKLQKDLGTKQKNPPRKSK